MPHVLLAVLPLAIGAAISPTISALVVAMLTAHPDERRRAYAFWLGAALSMVVWVAIVSSFVFDIVESATADVRSYSRIVNLVIGVLLIVVGVIRIVHKPNPDRHHKINFQALGNGSLKGQVLFGAIMQGRDVTSVLLFCAAQKQIDSADIPLWQKLVITAIVIFITTASIWLVILVPRSAFTRLDNAVAPTQSWVLRHARAIEIVAALGFGVYLVASSVIGFQATHP